MHVYNLPKNNLLPVSNAYTFGMTLFTDITPISDRYESEEEEKESLEQRDP